MDTVTEEISAIACVGVVLSVMAKNDKVGDDSEISEVVYLF